MRVITDIARLEDVHGGSFVPTMGALHSGHLSLIRRATRLGRPVVVSVFVNPTQFGPGEDFASYPRNAERDARLATDAGADVVFLPSTDAMYPPDDEIAVPLLPTIATQPGLEDRFRPGHFEGVCQVVARLFDLVRPAAAVFGEKDYQQLLVIRQLVAAQAARDPRRWGTLQIERGETAREPDGLALSSRNAYLNQAQRSRSLGLSVALHAARDAAAPSNAGVSPGEIERLMHDVLHEHDLNVDYAVLRHAETLMPVKDWNQPVRGLIAARVDRVRLIDNMAVGAHS